MLSISVDVHFCYRLQLGLPATLECLALSSADIVQKSCERYLSWCFHHSISLCSPFSTLLALQWTYNFSFNIYSHCLTSYLEALNCCCKKLRQTELQKKERESVSCFVPFTHTLLIYEWNNNWNEKKMYSNSALIFPTLSDCAACTRVSLSLQIDCSSTAMQICAKPFDKLSKSVVKFY